MPRQTLLALAMLLPQDAPEPPEPPAPPPPPLELRVNVAVDAACEWLLKQQEPGGGFGTGDKVHPLGRTALTLLALLHGGVSASEPRTARAIDFLVGRLAELRDVPAEVSTRSTYETGIALMLLHALGPQPRFAEAMPPLARFLVENFREASRLWGYPTGEPDLSNTQYAVLGLRAAMQSGIKLLRVKETLAATVAGILDLQHENGGFSYHKPDYETGSMTVAALACLRVCDDLLGGYGPAQKDLARARKAVERGQKWLEANYTVEFNPTGRSRSTANFHYYLYGLERYAAFYDLKRIGTHDWYAEGAEVLLARQNDDASWGSIEETCFAILFLEKASLSMPSERAQGEAPALPPRPPKPPALHPAKDVACVREWLVLGPFHGDPAADDALLVDHVGEAKVKPSPGKTTKKQKWLRVTSPDDALDLIKALAPNGGVPFDRVASYAAFTAIAPAEQDALLWLDSDDGVRAFHDGAMVLDDHHHDGKGEMQAKLHLKAGANLILLKVENVGYGCNVKARISDGDGAAIEGLELRS